MVAQKTKRITCVECGAKDAPPAEREDGSPVDHTLFCRDCWTKLEARLATPQPAVAARGIFGRNDARLD